MGSKHFRSDSMTSESAAKLIQLQQASNVHAESEYTSNVGTPKSVSARAKSSVDGETRGVEADEDSSGVDEADFGFETTANHQESTAEKLRLRLLLESFNSDQMARYEVFRRVGFNKISIKKFASAVISQALPQNIAVIIAGSSKIFVGEIIEQARRIQKDQGEAGSLRPAHLREAYRRYRCDSRRFPRNTRSFRKYV